MKLKEALEIPCGLRFVVESMEIQSPISRSALMEREFGQDINALEREYDAIREFETLVKSENVETRNLNGLIRHRTNRIKSVSQAVERLDRGGVSDEIDLYEIKSQAMLAMELSDLLGRAGIRLTSVECVAEVIDILDPDSIGVATFYVYDTYSERLGELRRAAKRSTDAAEREALIQESLEEEFAVRERLSQQLRPYAALMRRVQSSLIDIDIRLATATLMVRDGFVRPRFTYGERSSYAGLFHPWVKSLLEAEGKSFHPVNLEFGGALPTTIIGANMGGKTIALKMLALAQLMSQFALGVAADRAEISIKSEVILSSGDDSDGADGLSSFGAEVRRIRDIIFKARSGLAILALIDEPARTTNPVEGAALAAALVNIMANRKADLVLTTHYNLHGSHSERLRVAGYRGGRMDYSLIPTTESEIPREALTIARALGADDEWLRETERLLTENQ